MEKLKSVLYSVLNAAVIAAILIFILFGLWKIGLLEAPVFIQNLFGIKGRSESSDYYGIPEGILKNEGDYSDFTTESAVLSPENVKILLSDLIPEKPFVHDLQYTVYSQSGNVSQRILHVSDGETDYAYFVSSDGSIIKLISETNDDISIKTAQWDNSIKTEVYKTDDFDIESLTGAIMTHSDFLKYAEDTNYTFSLASGDVSGEAGSELIINFSVNKENYFQKEIYNLSLDYGIVTKAECFENGVLIYSLSTNRLTNADSIDSLGFEIPEGFLG